MNEQNILLILLAILGLWALFGQLKHLVTFFLITLILSLGGVMLFDELKQLGVEIDTKKVREVVTEGVAYLEGLTSEPSPSQVIVPQNIPIPINQQWTGGWDIKENDSCFYFNDGTDLPVCE